MFVHLFNPIRVPSRVHHMWVWSPESCPLQLFFFFLFAGERQASADDDRGNGQWTTFEGTRNGSLTSGSSVNLPLHTSTGLSVVQRGCGCPRYLFVYAVTIWNVFISSLDCVMSRPHSLPLPGKVFGGMFSAAIRKIRAWNWKLTGTEQGFVQGCWEWFLSDRQGSEKRRRRQQDEKGMSCG